MVNKSNPYGRNIQGIAIFVVAILVVAISYSILAMCINSVTNPPIALHDWQISPIDRWYLTYIYNLVCHHLGKVFKVYLNSVKFHDVRLVKQCLQMSSAQRRFSYAPGFQTSKNIHLINRIKGNWELYYNFHLKKISGYLKCVPLMQLIKEDFRFVDSIKFSSHE